jgi:hypothetical protein
MNKNVDLVKQIYGLNTYSKAVNTSFSELIKPAEELPVFGLEQEPSACP